MRPISPYTSQQPVTDYSLAFTPLIYSMEIPVQLDAITWVLPGDQGTATYKVVIRVNNDSVLWISRSPILASPPVTDEMQLSGWELINGNCDYCREMPAGDTLYFIAETNAVKISASLYSFIM